MSPNTWIGASVTFDVAETVRLIADHSNVAPSAIVRELIYLGFANAIPNAALSLRGCTTRHVQSWYESKLAETEKKGGI